MRAFAFALTFVVLFGLTYVFMAMVDALPDAPGTADAAQQQVSDTPETLAPDVQESPVRIVAKDIGLNIIVSNPTSTDVDILDNALLSGSVRYPTSALLGEEGTVLIFGHSSYLPIVHNQNYKAFDGVQNLKNGQVVSVFSATTEYRYQVTGVKLANADQDVIELPSTGRHLTLVTCDSFGTKSDRYVVTADLEGAYAITTGQ